MSAEAGGKSNAKEPKIITKASPFDDRANVVVLDEQRYALSGALVGGQL